MGSPSLTRVTDGLLNRSIKLHMYYGGDTCLKLITFHIDSAFHLWKSLGPLFHITWDESEWVTFNLEVVRCRSQSSCTLLNANFRGEVIARVDLLLRFPIGVDGSIIQLTIHSTNTVVAYRLVQSTLARLRNWSSIGYLD